MKRSHLLLGSTVALLLAWQKAGAAPLDEETCGKLNGERVQLEFLGAGTNMAKGPEWAKANLSADAVKQVLRLIDVEAQLLFRCTGSNLVNLPTEADSDTTKAGSNDAAKGEAAKAKPKSGTAKKAATVPAKAKKGSGSKAAAASDRQKAAAKPGGKGKAKVDDAYRPPPADPKANPFASQAPPPAK
jgi:hypothetical protein